MVNKAIRVAKTKRKIMEACHDDKVGGCHFGRDKTASKVSTQYYWKGIMQDVETWVCLLYFSVALLISMFILYCIYVGEIL